MKSRLVVLSGYFSDVLRIYSDNALIFYQAKKKLKQRPEAPTSEELAHDICGYCLQSEQNTIGQLHFPNRIVLYEDYWRCLAIGMEYVIELRWEAQWVAQRTTDDLWTLGRLMEEQVQERSEKEIDHLIHSLALTTRLLAHLRDVSIPMFISAADYSARKFERLINLCGLRQTVANAEANIQAINDFITQHQQQQAQTQADRFTRTVAIVGALLALLPLCIAFPSMWIDFEQSYIGRLLTGEANLMLPNFNLWLILLLTNIIFFAAMSYLAWRLLIRRTVSSSVRRED